MDCHQWCECSKCSTFFDECMNEIPNPHGEKSMSKDKLKPFDSGRLMELETKLQVAMEALEFYGNPDTYSLTTHIRPRIRSEHRMITLKDVEQVETHILPTGGKLARETISKIKAKQ